jgi:phosphatidyl-myo-inositol dimannoside synthase
VNQSLDVVIVTHEFPPKRGGAGVYCQEIAEGAHKIGINIELLVPEGSDIQDNFKTTFLPLKGNQSWKSSIQLFLFLRKFLKKTKNKNILHIADPGVCRSFIRLGFLFPKNARLLITIHGSELLKFTRNPIEKFCFGKLLLRSEKIHILSRFNYENCLRLFPLTKKKLKLIRGAPSKVVEAKKSMPFKKKDKAKLVLLCVGRIHPRKGQLELIQATSKLPEDIVSDLTLIFVGPIVSKPYFSKLKKESQNFRGEVEFKGDLLVEDLKECYQNADIFCLCPTVQKKSVEGFGFVYLEASSFGLPILATRTGGIEDAVIDGQTGLIADHKTPDELSEKLLELVMNKDLRKKLGGNGKIWAKQHRWKDIANKLYKEN